MRAGALLVAMGALALTACTEQTTGSPDMAVVDEAPAIRYVNTTPAIPQTPQLPAATVGDIDFESYSQDLAKWVGLEVGETRLSATDKIRLYFIPDDGRIIRTTSASFELPDGGVMILGASGIPDDSVKAEEIMAIFEGSAGSQTLAAYGMKIKCYRGENTTEWQTELCP